VPTSYGYLFLGLVDRKEEVNKINLESKDRTKHLKPYSNTLSGIAGCCVCALLLHLLFFSFQMQLKWRQASA
jgi:hypothetical protein